MSQWYVETSDGGVEPCGMPDAYVCTQVARDQVGESVVSTVFFGLDHSRVQGGLPVLYETLVIDGPLDDLCERYATRAEALAGHARMVARVRGVTL